MSYDVPVRRFYSVIAILCLGGVMLTIGLSYMSYLFGKSEAKAKCNFEASTNVLNQMQKDNEVITRETNSFINAPSVDEYILNY